MRSGFIISFRLNKEAKGLKEILSALQKLTESQSVEQDGRKSFKQLLKDEIEEYRNTTKFVKYSSHKSILFLENRSTRSSLSLFYGLRRSNMKFEYAQRVVPLEYFFRYNDDTILEIIRGLDESKTYKIMYEGRLCPSGIKQVLFDLITSNLTLKVNLTDPYYLIVVQTFKSYVGISVVVNEKRNFNFSCT